MPLINSVRTVSEARWRQKSDHIRSKSIGANARRRKRLQLGPSSEGGIEKRAIIKGCVENKGQR